EVAPGCMHKTCHTARMSPSVTSGGITRTAMRPSAGTSQVFRMFGLGASKCRTSAVAAGNGVTDAVFGAGMLMRVISVGKAGRGRPSGGPLRRSHLDALDGEALEISRRILRIEHFAVEEGLLAARGRGRDIGGRHRERLCGLAPEILAIDLAHE